MSDIHPTPAEDASLDTDPVLALLLGADPPAAGPHPGRLAQILLTGILLIGVAAVARTALEQAAAPPPGVTEPMSQEARGISPGPGTSVARYEYERARALR